MYVIIFVNCMVCPNKVLFESRLDLCAIYMWFMCELYVIYVWIICDLCVKYIWFMCELCDLCVNYMWFICDLCVLSVVMFNFVLCFLVKLIIVLLHYHMSFKSLWRWPWMWTKRNSIGNCKTSRNTKYNYCSRQVNIWNPVLLSGSFVP